MSKQNREKLISRYREGPSELADAVSRLSEKELDHKPSDGGFSAREVVTTPAAPVQPSLDAIRAARESTASSLEALSEPERERAGTHSEMGEYSIDAWLEVYAAHCHDHADQIRRAAKEALG
jgi:hypothetical protein